jgi:hypothetical protein
VCQSQPSTLDLCPRSDWLISSPSCHPSTPAHIQLVAATGGAGQRRVRSRALLFRPPLQRLLQGVPGCQASGRTNPTALWLPTQCGKDKPNSFVVADTVWEGQAQQVCGRHAAWEGQTQQVCGRHAVWEGQTQQVCACLTAHGETKPTGLSMPEGSGTDKPNSFAVALTELKLCQSDSTCFPASLDVLSARATD